MTEPTTESAGGEHTSDRNTAVQGVLDRITSYQDGAPEGTVEKELRAALDEVGLDLDDSEIARLVEAVEGTDGPVQAEDVLGA